MNRFKEFSEWEKQVILWALEELYCDTPDSKEVYNTSNCLINEIISNNESEEN